MASTISWLDASSEEQRRMREIVELFMDRESRDELGIGVIRDTIADGLFPGTSTLLTRARYLLFIPWCHQLASRQSDTAWAVNHYERRLIGPLAGSEGAFGRVSGSGLKRLPSSVYWAALTRWGILLEPEAALAPVVHRLQDDEAARHPVDAWSPTLPTIPDGFPDEVRDGFDLSLQEASWLRDRMLATVDGSLLTWLLAHRPRESGPFWSDPAISDAPGAIGDLVHHARMFATAMQGASLLYNLLLADDLGRLAVTPPPRLADYRDRLARWGADADAVGLRQWRPDWLWGWVSGQGVRIPPSTRRFVDGWVTQLGLVSGLPDLSDATAARAFIRDRERQHKRSQARIGNRKRLSQWGGSSGAGELQFRWPQVRRILLDIHEGLERDA